MKEYFDVQNLKIAWERCCRDTNRDVKDYAGIDLFGFSIEENLKNLSDILLSGEYKPSRPAKFYEPKSTGTQRTKTILCIEDAIVYQCITDKIATKKLKMKEMKTISTPENPKSPLRIFDLTNSSRNT